MTVPAPKDWVGGSMLREWAAAVLGVVPAYACFGWGGPGEGRAGRERHGAPRQRAVRSIGPVTPTGHPRSGPRRLVAPTLGDAGDA